jgi:hypothetical protein
MRDFKTYEKNSKKTIKAQALNFIAGSYKPTKRSAVIDFIKSINGTKSEAKSGYYSDAFVSWENEGLIQKKDGIFSITKFGKEYLKNPAVLREKKAKERIKREKDALNYYRDQAYELRKLIWIAKRKAEDMQWDLDRMSRSGEITYFELLQILNTNF